jgi:formylglycine-generating enzyme required for sulfatase activity
VADGTGGASDSFGSGSNQFSMAFVTVGNAGNPGDPNSNQNYGSVPYEYRISTYEVSQSDIAMATAGGLEGVTAGAWSDDQPAAFMKWYEAAAFVNWLNTTSGYQPAYNLAYNGGSTNSSWVMSLWPSDQAWTNGGQNLYRNANAYYFLPNDNEWFKAAYYNGATADYWNYPTASNTSPTAVPSGTAAGTAVYGYDPTSLPAPVKSAGGLSAYGTMGQGGNVAEWMETSATGSNTVPYADRSFNGAAVNDQSQQLQADNRTAFNVNPAFESPYIGFRVASAAIGTGSAGVSQTVGRHRPGNGRPSGKPSKPRTGVGGINPTPTTGAGTSIVGTAIVPQG